MAFTSLSSISSRPPVLLPRRSENRRRKRTVLTPPTPPKPPWPPDPPPMSRAPPHLLRFSLSLFISHSTAGQLKPKPPSSFLATTVLLIATPTTTPTTLVTSSTSWLHSGNDRTTRAPLNALRPASQSEAAVATAHLKRRISTTPSPYGLDMALPLVSPTPIRSPVNATKVTRRYALLSPTPLHHLWLLFISCTSPIPLSCSVLHVSFIIRKHRTRLKLLLHAAISATFMFLKLPQFRPPANRARYGNRTISDPASTTPTNTKGLCTKNTSFALKAALDAASSLEFQHLTVYFDSQSLDSHNDVNELKSVHVDIRCLLETFSSIFCFYDLTSLLHVSTFAY